MVIIGVLGNHCIVTEVSPSLRTPGLKEFYLMVFLVFFNIYAKCSPVIFLKKNISPEVIIALLLLKTLKSKLNDALSLNSF